jgi:hypothetical protein
LGDLGDLLGDLVLVGDPLFVFVGVLVAVLVAGLDFVDDLFVGIFAASFPLACSRSIRTAFTPDTGRFLSFNFSFNWATVIELQATLSVSNIADRPSSSRDDWSELTDRVKGGILRPKEDIDRIGGLVVNAVLRNSVNRQQATTRPPSRNDEE